MYYEDCKNQNILDTDQSQKNEKDIWRLKPYDLNLQNQDKTF